MSAMKNRYCRRTKLSEEEFMRLIVYFCRGWPATTAHSQCADMGVKISRQTIEKKFLEFGDYFYRKFTRPQFLQLYKDCNPGIERPDDEWEQQWLDEIWHNMRGTLDYAAFRRDNMPYTGHDTLIRTLQGRWQLFNGFARENFRSHLGFATFFDGARQHSTMEVAISQFIREFEKDPL